MCDEKQNECRDHGDPPWEGPQVIPAQIRRVDNLIFRKINQFARATVWNRPPRCTVGSSGIFTGTGRSRCFSGTLSGSFPLPAPP